MLSSYSLCSRAWWQIEKADKTSNSSGITPCQVRGVECLRPLQKSLLTEGLASYAKSAFDNSQIDALTRGSRNEQGAVEEIVIVAILYASDSFKGKTMTNSKENQLRAEAQVHKTIKKQQEAKQAMSEYEADARAVGEKTAKLRALRLAKEAAEAAEKEAQITKRAASKRAAAGPLPEQET